MKNDDALDSLIALAKRHDLPPDDAEAHAWAGFVAALGPGGGGDTGMPVAEAAAASKGGTVLALAAKGLAVAAVASVAGLAVVTAKRSAEPQPRPVVEAESAPAAPSVSPPADPPERVPAVAPTLAPEPSTTPAPATPRRRGRPEPAPAVAPASTLAEEARLVGSMWKALDRNDADAALALSARYAREYGEGELQTEARAAALVARCTLGRPINLTALASVRKTATRAVLKRLDAACSTTP